MKNIEIFTDGSCNTKEKNGGYGLVIIEDGRVVASFYGAYKNTTNNRMELRAFLEGLKYVVKYYDLSNDEIAIYSDSAYIVNCFNQQWYKQWLVNGWYNSKRTKIKNIDLWEEILLIGKGIATSGRIKIAKVAAHTGNTYNETADKLANKWRTMEYEHFNIDEK